jgi:histidinol phosphatase-like PHP family hydrolase
LVISTDSHHTSELRRMEFGVANAQRGWAPVDAVANTLDPGAFLEFASSRR